MVIVVCTSPAFGLANHRIPDSKITASSAGIWFLTVFKPHLARLHASTAWVAGLLDLNPYLQISFSPIRRLITGIATQGNPGHDWWTTSYVLTYSINEYNWMYYKTQGITEVRSQLNISLAQLQKSAIQLPDSHFLFYHRQPILLSVNK